MVSGHSRRLFLGATAALIALACGGQADKDGDGFFNDDNLCGGPLFDCNDESRAETSGDIYFADCDFDGLGDQESPIYLCPDPEIECPVEMCPVAANALDCDDSPDIGATIGAGVPVYPDCDGDSLGDAGRSITWCQSSGVAAPTEDFNGCTYVLNGDDCDDTDGNIRGVDELWVDCDGDTFGSDDVGPLHFCGEAQDLELTEGLKECPLVEQGGDCVDDPDEEGTAINPDTDPDGELCPGASTE